MDSAKLIPIFSDIHAGVGVPTVRLKAIYAYFEADFVTTPLKVEGKTVKIFMVKSKIKEYAEYPETFVHLITRKCQSINQRLYEDSRAVRINWIKPILLSHPCKEILYFKWKEDGECREHFWLFSKDFMVVTKEISPDIRIVTAFCVDKEEKLRFYERWDNYKNGNGNCQ